MKLWAGFIPPQPGMRQLLFIFYFVNTHTGAPSGTIFKTARVSIPDGQSLESFTPEES